MNNIKENINSINNKINKNNKILHHLRSALLLTTDNLIKTRLGCLINDISKKIITNKNSISEFEHLMNKSINKDKVDQFEEIMIFDLENELENNKE